jgi:hypothetical protein
MLLDMFPESVALRRQTEMSHRDVIFIVLQGAATSAEQFMPATFFSANRTRNDGQTVPDVQEFYC